MVALLGFGMRKESLLIASVFQEIQIREFIVNISFLHVKRKAF